MESCSPKNPLPAKSQVPEEEQLFELEEDAIAPNLNQESNLEGIETTKVLQKHRLFLLKLQNSLK